MSTGGVLCVGLELESVDVSVVLTNVVVDVDLSGVEVVRWVSLVLSLSISKYRPWSPVVTARGCIT